MLVSCISVGDMPSHIDTQPDETKKDVTDKTDSTTVDTEKNEPPVDPKKTVKVIAAGDALIHSAIYREAEAIAANKNDFTGKYYFKDMYKGVAELVGSSDIAFVNHEAPIAKTSISGYPNFNAPSESGDDLVDLGFNVINIANNHMFDVDNKTTGYADTIEYWATKDVLQVGGYKNEEDYNNIRVLEIQGIKIAFLAYTYDPYSSNRTSMNKKSKEAGYVLPLINDDVITRHISLAKQKAELVFVSVHWGTENVFKPTKEQERVAQLIADNGADVILGHHSHTLQPIKWLTGVNGNKTLCAYSLGNLISGMLSSKNMVGGFITLDIVNENGKVSIENVVFEPTVCHYVINNFSQKDPEGNPVRTEFQVYMMKDYTEALAKNHGVQNYGKCTLDTFKGYVKNTISSEFLPDYLK